MSDFSRRSLVRGVAWTVPVVAVAAHTPAFASSQDPGDPIIDFGGACGNVGNGDKGCGGKFTLQVPLTLSNPTLAPVVFQITSMLTRNTDGSAPTDPNASGVTSGIRGIWSTPSHAEPNEDNCTAVAQSQCTGGVAGGSIIVPAGADGLTYWIESKTTDNASKFSSRITWRLLTPTCTVLRSGESFTSVAIAPGNCNGS